MKEKVELQKDEIELQKQKSDALLLNILPKEVADELKENGSTVAKLFKEVSVIFTDFVGFTELSSNLSPTELVSELHKAFSAFDHIIEKYDLEKIKTIGDSYMAVGGLPLEHPDHAINVVKAALEIKEYIENSGSKFQIRIGINSGPVVAGIVGIKKFAYDIWGDTVNVASRMETHGVEGEVNISASTYELIKENYHCEFREEISVKGKGKMLMYLVKGKKSN